MKLVSIPLPLIPIMNFLQLYGWGNSSINGTGYYASSSPIMEPSIDSSIYRGSPRKADAGPAGQVTVATKQKSRL